MSAYLPQDRGDWDWQTSTSDTSDTSDLPQPQVPQPQWQQPLLSQGTGWGPRRLRGRTTETQELRLFADAYEEQLRHRTSPTMREVDPDEMPAMGGAARGQGSGMLVGLAAFVLLLVVAIGVGLVLNHP